MCGEPIADEHQHVVDLGSRSLMCTCRACYLLFTDDDAALRYRAVPDRYLSFPASAWPARPGTSSRSRSALAFFFRNSALDRVVAFYPGPAGATESELDLAAWDASSRPTPRWRHWPPDVEAVLVGAAPTEGAGVLLWCRSTSATSWSARLRMLWRGFDGGQEVRDAHRRVLRRRCGRAPAEQVAP